ncbi:hypothetical protein YPPY98_2347, partial [Yersinia pestis PY-98]
MRIGRGVKRPRQGWRGS